MAPAMPPRCDGIPARRFPFVNVAIIAVNFLVWIQGPSSRMSAGSSSG
jgi:hypothetical protein